jgi:transcription termination factor Rho
METPLDIAELKKKTVIRTARHRLGAQPPELSGLRKQDLIFRIEQKLLDTDVTLRTEGVLEVLPEGYGFLRSSDWNYLYGPTTSTSSRRRSSGSTSGPATRSRGRSAPEGGRTLPGPPQGGGGEPGRAREGEAPHHLRQPPPPLPGTRLRLENAEGDISMRVMDLIAPIGMGQRGLIVSPPKAGKTTLLQKMANSIRENHPDVYLIVLLIDERPEEVTDMEEHVDAEVVSSTFDEPAERHTQVAEMVLDKAKRLVEHGKDVVILLDSITRLARAYNVTVPHSGKILSGGVDANALHKPKRFFGAARNIDEGAPSRSSPRRSSRRGAAWTR